MRICSTWHYSNIAIPEVSPFDIGHETKYKSMKKKNFSRFGQEKKFFQQTLYSCF